jgi:hypothetical protein
MLLLFLSMFIIGSNYTVVKTQPIIDLGPTWEVVASELPDITLHSVFSDWSEVGPTKIFLVDLSQTGETLEIQTYFGYNDSKLLIGLLIPKSDEQVINGVEIIFYNDHVLDGIIIDSELQEARDVAYVNHTYVAYDTDLGGREDVNVVITDEGDNDFYMIVDETRFPEGDLDSDWEFDDGDSVAVVFQAWVNKPMDNFNRPNYSTAGSDFNYLRLSIKEDNGWLIDPAPPWDLMWEESDLPEVSYHERETNVTLDGKKDEDCWLDASSSKIKLFLVSKTAPTSLLHTADPSYIEVTITFTYDKDYLYMFLEIPHESNDTNLEELILLFGNDKHCLQNLSAPLLLIKINPTEESFARSGINAELRVSGIVPVISPDYYGVVSTVQTYGIQGLEYANFRDFGSRTIENVEVKILDFGIASGAIRPFTDSDSPGSLYLSEMTIRISDLDPTAPYDNPWSAMTLEDEQLYFNLYKIIFPNETSTPTRTISFFSTTVFTLLSVMWVLTIRKRLKKTPKL